MTRLPIESRLAVDRPDLPEYELNEFCPITGESWGLEAHHIFRRSAGYPSWWVELPDGDVIGNRIRLSRETHARVTTNETRIVYANGVYYYVEDDERKPMRWQPPTLHQRKPVFQSHAVMGDTVYDMNTHEVVQKLGPQPGEECSACHRRVPHPKKASSPAETKPMTFGRAPADAADELKQRIDDLAKTSGLSEQAYPQVRAIMLALLLAESVDPETLAEVASGMTWGRKVG